MLLNAVFQALGSTTHVHTVTVALELIDDVRKFNGGYTVLLGGWEHFVGAVNYARLDGVKYTRNDMFRVAVFRKNRHYIGKLRL